MSVANSIAKGDFNLNLITLRKPLEFPDGTIQDTAYTGDGSEDLEEVLNVGNNANGQDILGVGTLEVNTQIELTPDGDTVNFLGEINQVAVGTLFGGNQLIPTLINSGAGLSTTVGLQVNDIGGTQGLYVLPNATNNLYNPIVNANDVAVVGNSATQSLAICCDSATTNGVRITDTTMLLGAGGNADTPTNNILFNTGSGLSISAQNTTKILPTTQGRTTVPILQVQNDTQDINFIADTTNATGNPIVNGGDNTITSQGGGALTLTAQSATTNGIRMTASTIGIGAGGTTSTPSVTTTYNLTAGKAVTTSTAGTVIQTTDISPTATLEVKETSTNYAMLFIPKSDGGQYNPLDTANSNEMVGFIDGTTLDNGQALAIVPHSGTTCGVRMVSGTGGSGTNAYLEVGCGGTVADPTQRIRFNNATSQIQMTYTGLSITTGALPTTAGAPVADYLPITINGTVYKIALLANT